MFFCREYIHLFFDVVSFEIGALNVIELNSFNPFFGFSPAVSYVRLVLEFVTLRVCFGLQVSACTACTVYLIQNIQ